MGYRDDMAKSRNYIDEHLDEDIDPHTLSDMSGYSYYHFCHVFRSVNGMPVYEYLRDRRLSKAAVELSSGARVIDAALENGFDTPSGFTRAFTRRFGMTPSQYKKRKGGTVNMKPEIKKMEAFTAVGYIIRPEGEIDIKTNGAYWIGKDFSSVSGEDYAKLNPACKGEIGAWMHHPDKTDELYYFFGPIVKDKSFIPKGMEAIDVPAALYAIFPVEKAGSKADLHDNVQKTWKFVFNDWFDGSGYAFDHTRMDFELYFGENTSVFVPVIKK